MNRLLLALGMATFVSCGGTEKASPSNPTEAGRETSKNAKSSRALGEKSPIRTYGDLRIRAMRGGFEEPTKDSMCYIHQGSSQVELTPGVRNPSLLPIEPHFSPKSYVVLTRFGIANRPVLRALISQARDENATPSASQSGISRNQVALLAQLSPMGSFGKDLPISRLLIVTEDKVSRIGSNAWIVNRGLPKKESIPEEALEPKKGNIVYFILAPDHVSMKRINTVTKSIEEKGSFFVLAGLLPESTEVNTLDTSPPPAQPSTLRTISTTSLKETLRDCTLYDSLGASRNESFRYRFRTNSAGTIEEGSVTVSTPPSFFSECVTELLPRLSPNPKATLKPETEFQGNAHVEHALRWKPLFCRD